MTKAQRLANRQYALANISQIRAIATRVDINDVHGAHVTVYIGKRRVEWWPGNGKWAANGPGTSASHTGSFADFSTWLAEQKDYGYAADDDFCVIE